MAKCAPSLQKNRSPKTRVVYSDRFIPSRVPSARLDYSVLERGALDDLVTKQGPSDSGADAAEPSASSSHSAGSGAYTTLLRSQLLGCGPGSPSRGSVGSLAGPGSGGAAPRSPTRSPSRNLFRFMAGDADTPLNGALPGSPFARGPLGEDPTLPPAAGGSTGGQRRIPRTPFKVLDAPALSDDFYLNLVDWSSANVLAVGLGHAVYLWSAHTSKVTCLVDLSADTVRHVTSVCWSARGSCLAIGVDDGTVQIWDVASQTKLRTMVGHGARVACMSWGGSSATLATGSRDASVLLRDPREPDDYASRLCLHRSEVCGLRWAPDGRQLASGGNDNMLCVWDARWTTAGGGGPGGGHTGPEVGMSPAASRRGSGAAPALVASAQPLHRWAEHRAAVKALAWSPHAHGLLASGGGSADRMLRVWNTGTGSCVAATDTGSQVCCLAWSKNANELVSTHGYSQNAVALWRYPGLTRVATLTGHAMRVLYLAASPDGQTIVTGAGDETLRFWNVFPEASRRGSAAAGSSIGTHSRASIR